MPTPPTATNTVIMLPTGLPNRFKCRMVTGGAPRPVNTPAVSMVSQSMGYLQGPTPVAGNPYVPTQPDASDFFEGTIDDAEGLSYSSTGFGYKVFMEAWLLMLLLLW
ncbi:hypothetical protein HDU76_002719 [Blyttiomyces sp. JEL0837]|nr:hypothetical protein HDU76_002719 [Blyttiomyces sp. JEL0837]